MQCLHMNAAKSCRFRVGPISPDYEAQTYLDRDSFSSFINNYFISFVVKMFKSKSEGKTVVRFHHTN